MCLPYILQLTLLDMSYKNKLWPCPCKKKNIKSLHAKFNDWQHQRKVGIHYRASSKSLNRRKKQPTASYYKRSQLLVGHSSISISGMYSFFFFIRQSNTRHALWNVAKKLKVEQIYVKEIISISDQIEKNLI